MGFLSANRRFLAVGAIAASGLLTSIPSLPAEADAFLGPAAVQVPLQSFTAPVIYEPPVVRDSFGISTYSVVQWPVPVGTTISSGFGLRECDGCSTDHTGTDFNPGNGFAIPAIADGVVTEAGWDSTGYGNKVVIQHNIDGQIVSTLYAHMQDNSIAVSVGQVITRGTILGLVGETGEATGPHLHFSVIIDGTMVDPYPWLLAHVNI
jgi:murein DD-endopeptidase MepM/ murein hydrolase activator NlpD